VPIESSGIGGKAGQNRRAGLVAQAPPAARYVAGLFACQDGRGLRGSAERHELSTGNDANGPPGEPLHHRLPGGSLRATSDERQWHIRIEPARLLRDRSQPV
jgi:hypothetical protein